jgi:hypothetical protein
LYSASLDEISNAGYNVEFYNYFYLYGDAFTNQLVPFYRCLRTIGGHWYTTNPTCDGAGPLEGIVGNLSKTPLTGNCGGPNGSDTAKIDVWTRGGTNPDMVLTIDPLEGPTLSANGYVFKNGGSVYTFAKYPPGG